LGWRVARLRCVSRRYGARTVAAREQDGAERLEARLI
jgi:hypothetical protein